MPMIAKSSVREVTERLDAVAVVSEYVRLEQRGGRWWGLCPFHQEKTGSFTVNPDLKVYHCFGCGKGGSVLGFVMEMDKLSFPEAVEMLAKKTGVELVYEQGGGEARDDSRREQLFDLYRRLAAAFHHFLMEKSEGREAKRYILSRGLGEEMLESFNLGYAPADRGWLFGFLKKKGYSGEFLAASGLFSSRHPEFPLFAGRLMFPIADRQGRVAAFGGRALPERPEGRETPKYINSPETAIFRKGQTLFALDRAVPEIRKTRAVYLVEGYMDALALHAAGAANAVAPLGTSFTDDQARLLRRWAEKAFLVFDSDEAGQQAAVKGILTCRRAGLEAAVVNLRGGEAARNAAAPPEIKDPADILKIYGAEALQNSLKCTINEVEYLIARAKFLFDISASGGKARAAAFLFPYLEVLDSEVSREACIEAAAKAFGVAPQAVAADFRNRGRGRGLKRPGETVSEQAKRIQSNDELRLLMAVVNGGVYPAFRREVTLKEVENPAAKELFLALEECFARDETGIDSLLARIPSPELRDFIVSRGASPEFAMNPERIVADGVKRMKRKRRERRREEIVRRLRALKNGAGAAETEELLAEKMHIDEELQRTDTKEE
ncbi:MAG: DNA primase [Treponematales bacterium]